MKIAIIVMIATILVLLIYKVDKKLVEYQEEENINDAIELISDYCTENQCISCRFNNSGKQKCLFKEPPYAWTEGEKIYDWN